MGPPQKYVSFADIQKQGLCHWGVACLPGALSTSFTNAADVCNEGRSTAWVSACETCLNSKTGAISGPWFVSEANDGAGACCSDPNKPIDPPGCPELTSDARTHGGLGVGQPELPPSPYASWISTAAQCACAGAPSVRVGSI